VGEEDNFMSRAVDSRSIFAQTHVMFYHPSPNPALDLALFGRWTLRDEAAQHRSALR